MRSIPAALTWELFKRGKWSFPGAFLTGNALTIVLLSALRRDGAINPEDSSMVTMHTTMLYVNATVFGGALCAAMGNPSRLRAFPAPNSVIVAWQLLPAMVVMALECLLSTAVVNALFKVNWPLWGPALFMSVALAAFAAVFWVTEKSPWHFFFLGLPVLVGIALWFNSRYGMAYHAPPSRMWRDVTAADGATMLLMAIGSYYAAVVGVARGRCGEYLSTPEFLRQLGRLIDRLLDPAPEAGRPFRSAAEAQFWLEWRQKGWALPTIVIMGLTSGFIAWLLCNRNPRDLFDGAIAAGAMLPVGGLIVGLFFGNASTNLGGTLEMGPFLAARPLTSPDMSRITLRAAGVSVIVAWLIWVAAYFGLYAILLLANVAPRSLFPSEVGWWYFPLTLLGTWLALTCVATIGQAGRPSLFGSLFIGVPAAAFGIILISHFVLTPEAAQLLLAYVTSLIGVVYLLGTIWAFVAARRRAAIGSSTVWAASSACAVLCALLVLFWSQHRSEYPAALPFLVHGVGALALVVFPIAAAPLTLAWNRNR